MKKKEWRTLRGQVLLIGGMLFGCLMLAITLSTQRSVFESYLKESYDDVADGLSARLEHLVGNAENNRADNGEFALLSDNDLVALYEHWMATPDTPRKKLPKVLVSTSPLVYIARVERTLVCGDSSQRKRALEFLKLADSKSTIEMLRRVETWATKRNMAEFTDSVNQAITYLSRMSEKDSS